MLVSGRVIGSGTGVGLPDLVVSFAAGDRQGNGGAVGSARTDAKGAFALELPDGLGRLRATVHRAGDRQSNPLAEADVEPDTAELLIEVADGQPLDDPQLDVVPFLERERIDRDADEEYRRITTEAQKAAFVEGLREGRALRLAAREKFQHFLAALSQLPQEVRQSSRYVRDGESVREVGARAMGEQLQTVVRNHLGRTSIALSDDVLSTLEIGPDGSVADGRTAMLDALLRPIGSFVARRPERMCASITPRWDGCLSHLQKEGDTGGADPVPTTVSTNGDQPTPSGTAPASAPDVHAMIAALTRDIVGPAGGIGGRAGLEEIQAVVDNFSLMHGPADVPAVQDFYGLRIAFEPVWTELFAENVTGSGAELYERIVEAGEDPNQYLLDEVGSIHIGGKGSEVKKASAKSVPSAKVVRVFDVTPLQWSTLNPVKREVLESLARGYLKLKHLPPTKELEWPWGGSLKVPLDEATLKERERQMRSRRAEGQSILRWADRNATGSDWLDQYHDTLAALTHAMKEPYRFSIYAANFAERSINFGVVCNYRQTWTPINYQPGRLVKTIPLAPKEVRRFTKKVTQNRSRSRNEIDNRLRSRSTESQDTVRAEVEIVQKARAKTNFSAGAEGSFNMLVAGAKASQAFGSEDETESAETKREFREAIRKAAEEFKTEHNVEINASASVEDVAEESGEISNPNDEITVTYLFYELERRYRLAEKLQSVTPVMLVAQEVPKPDQIDEDWLIAHDWVIRRAILDDSFIPALDYLSTGMVGDEAALDEQRRTLEQQRQVVEELNDQLISRQREVGRRYAALESSIRRRAEAIQADEEEGFLEEAWETGFGSGDTSEAALKVREAAAKDAHERARQSEKDLEARLASETASITEMTQVFSEALSQHLNRRAQITRLRVHVKSNILYYMQAIWSYEPPDQRFFRLHEVPVPRLKGKKTYKIVDDPDATPQPPSFSKPKKVTMTVQLELETTDPLASVADLDNLLGFKGNYMIFPMRQGNDVTDLMTLPYAHPELGLRDPDPNAGWTLAQFSDYVCCMHNKTSPTDWQQLRPKLLEFYLSLLKHGGGEDDEIVVPTGSLFIEALPGSHPVLEDFKLLHRATDVRQALSDVRARELENVRAAARLLSGEREDPSIEQKVVIEGGDGEVVVDPNP